MQVDAVIERPRNSRLVFDRAFRRAAARPRGVGQIAATTRIKSENQGKSAEIADMRVDPRDGDAAGLDRLTQRIENLPREFGQFIEKQHALMSE